MTENKTPTGKKPQEYKAFWHLEAVNVLQVDQEGTAYDSNVWESLETREAKTPALVALIDTGVSNHGYLKENVDCDRGLDLTGMPIPPAVATGTRAGGPFCGINRAMLENDLGIHEILRDRDLFERLVGFVEEQASQVPFDTGAPNTANRLFSAHGTACAGLVVAKSPLEEMGDGGTPKKKDAEVLKENGTTAGSGSNEDKKKTPQSLAYYGVDPFSKLFSITTTFAPKPRTLILAFLYAYKNQADVILFPRGLNANVEQEWMLEDENDDESAATQSSAVDWLLLRAVILGISRRIPIVCPAGNDAESRLIPPASLALVSPGDNGIIAVGAMAYNGHRASYSTYGNELTVTAPSDDGEMLNVDQARLDETDRFFENYPYQETIKAAKWQNKEFHEAGFSEATVLAIDVPGTFGFSASGNQSNGDGDSVTPYSGHFTEFGGTSAAASIVAGVVALMQRAAKSRSVEGKAGERLSGPKIRKILTETARPHDADLPHLEGAELGDKKLKGDRINDQLLTLPQAFGSGLVDAEAAVERTLTT